MISKIKIQGVTSYKQEAILETETPINLVYGLNGSGKTTISNYLRTPLDTKYSHCKLIPPNVTEDYVFRVYNQSFVEDVFYSKDVQKGIFTLSKESKEIELKIIAETKNRERIAQKVVGLRELIEKKNRKVSQLDKETQESCFEIKKTFSGDDRVLDDAGFLNGVKSNKAKLFDKLLQTPVPEQPRDIDTLKKEVEQLLKADGTPSAQLAVITPLETLSNIEASPIFEEVIVSRSNSTLSSLIEKLNNTNWFTQGVPYLESSEELCPFCQQDLSSERKNEILNFLDEAYKEKITKLKTHAENYEESSADLIPEQEKSLIEKFATAEQKLALENKQKDLEGVLSKNNTVIQSKISAPNEVRSLSASSSYIGSYNEMVQAINESIQTHNNKLREKDKTLNALKDEFWQIQRKEYAPTLDAYSARSKALTDELSKIQKDRDEEAAQYKTSDEAIKSLQQQTANIQDTIDQINLLLTECGITGIYLEQAGANSYKISRENNQGEQVFQSLSEGEKTMISFFYFLELCRIKASPDETQKKIIVIDDPISSLSHMYVYNVAQFIKREFFDAYKINKNTGRDELTWSHKTGTQYQQCFVLTHSLYFFYELADSLNHRDRKILCYLYRVNKNDQGSNISKLSYSEIQNDYQAYWSIVRDPNAPTALLANSMRNIIEHFFNFIEKLDLNNTFQKEALSDNKFQSFKRYMGRESHTLAQNIFDTKEFDYDTFKEAFRLVFEENGYPDHYKKMMKK